MSEDQPASVETSDAETSEIWREGITMALYISLSQLAVMVALPTQQVQDASNLALTIALTSIGLILAHQLAFRLSTRLVAKGSTVEGKDIRLLRAQLVGGGLVTLVAVLPVLLFGNGAYRVSLALLLLFVLLVSYLAARSAPNSRTRSLVYVLIIGVLVVGVLFVKNLVSH